MAINVHYAYTFEENIEIIKYSYLEVMIKQTTSLYVKYIILYATQLSMLIQVEMYMSSEHIRSKTVISKYKSEKKKILKPNYKNQIGTKKNGQYFTYMAHVNSITGVTVKNFCLKEREDKTK